jgi:hypothetical protein
MRDIKNKQISNVHHNIITEQIYIELYFCWLSNIGLCSNITEEWIFQECSASQ